MAGPFGNPVKGTPPSRPPSPGAHGTGLAQGMDCRPGECQTAGTVVEPSAIPELGPARLAFRGDRGRLVPGELILADRSSWSRSGEDRRWTSPVGCAVVACIRASLWPMVAAPAPMSAGTAWTCGDAPSAGLRGWQAMLAFATAARNHRRPWAGWLPQRPPGQRTCNAPAIHQPAPPSLPSAPPRRGRAADVAWSYLSGWAMVSITAVDAKIRMSFSSGATSTP